MMDGIWLFLLLFKLIGPNAIKYSEFDVHMNTGVWSSDTIIATASVESLIDCASMCAVHQECCSSDFDTTTMKCTLFSLDCKTAIVSSNHIVLSRQQGVNEIRDCNDLPKCSPSGIYTIYPENTSGFDVFCNMTMDSGGWTVFQRRIDGSTDFYRKWSDYEEGFGDLAREVWLGNRKLHQITSSGSYKLRVELGDFAGEYRYAVYSNFSVGDAESKYTLYVNGYNGTAGDSLSYHNGMPFSTYDNDNDKIMSNCAEQYNSSWWYKSCSLSNLNGLYLGGKSTDVGIEWLSWRRDYSFRMTMMAIKRNR